MATNNLAVILRNPANDAEFLLLKQTPPPKFGEEEYDSYVDSDLWDLPSTRLNVLEGETEPGFFIEGANLCLEKINLRKFDVELGLNQVMEQLGFKISDAGEWRLLKYVEEPEFGPGNPVNTVFVVGKLLAGCQDFRAPCMWMSTESCLNWLQEVKPSTDRIGPLIVVGLINDIAQSAPKMIPPTLHYQEYPPGVILVPMQSRTGKPFHTTNLIIFAPENVSDESKDNRIVAHGDALIVDPGCLPKYHDELGKIVAALPKRLVVFLTHHHHDHVDGLSVIQKCNPDATLLAHENTMHRVGKGDWSLGYTSVSGGEDILVGGQRLTVIFAPGHTDGHVALLHVSTHSLIVGDHCVGQGSAVLDITSGGNMIEYFQSTYKFMELSPHVLIPMHGRANLWPKNMLCAYLKNRRSREASILRAIDDGAETLFDIVANVYSGVDRSFWIPAASNVRLHVDHLAQQNKLPKEFSIQKYQKTCGVHFLSRWVFSCLRSRFLLNYQKLGISRLLIAGAVAGFGIYYYSMKSKLSSK
ncbi:hypothetical protein SLA2020_174380 [Shorea laevis]